MRNRLAIKIKCRAHTRERLNVRDSEREIWRLSNRCWFLLSLVEANHERGSKSPFYFYSSHFTTSISEVIFVRSPITMYNVSRVESIIGRLTFVVIFLTSPPITTISKSSFCVFRLFYFTSEKKKNDSPITKDNCHLFDANKLSVRFLDFPIKSIYCLPTFCMYLLQATVNLSRSR